MFLFGNLAAFAAYLVKGLTGFANTLVFSSILSFRTANRNITPIDLILGLPSNAYIAWKERESIRPRVIVPLTATLLLGMIPGTLFLKSGDERVIKLILGCAVVLLAVEMLLRERKTTPSKQRPVVLLLIAVLSGFLCGLFGIGAFLVAYISRTTSTAAELRGNICCVFLAENLVRIGLYLWLGLLNPSVLYNVVFLIPGMAVGLLAGLFLSRRVSEGRTKRMVIGLLFLMGISVVLNNLW